MKIFLKNFFLGVFSAAVIFFITALTSGGMQAATKRPGGAIAWLVIWGLSTKWLTYKPPADGLEAVLASADWCAGCICCGWIYFFVILAAK